MNNEVSVFGEHLKQLRVLSSFTQQYVGEAVGVGKSFISRLECGFDKTASEELLNKLAALYKVDPDGLILLSGKVPEDFRLVLLDHPEMIASLRDLAGKLKRE